MGWHSNAEPVPLDGVRRPEGHVVRQWTREPMHHTEANDEGEARNCDVPRSAGSSQTAFANTMPHFLCRPLAVFRSVMARGLPMRPSDRCGRCVVAERGQPTRGDQLQNLGTLIESLKKILGPSHPHHVRHRTNSVRFSRACSSLCTHSHGTKVQRGHRLSWPSRIVPYFRAVAVRADRSTSDVDSTRDLRASP